MNIIPKGYELIPKKSGHIIQPGDRWDHEDEWAYATHDDCGLSIDEYSFTTWIRIIKPKPSPIEEKIWLNQWD